MPSWKAGEQHFRSGPAFCGTAPQTPQEASDPWLSVSGPRRLWASPRHVPLLKHGWQPSELGPKGQPSAARLTQHLHLSWATRSQWTQARLWGGPSGDGANPASKAVLVAAVTSSVPRGRAEKVIRSGGSSQSRVTCFSPAPALILTVLGL